MYSDILTFGIQDVVLYSMNSIIEYKNYRIYIQAYYEERKALGFTWRDFAAQSGFSSPVFLKYVSEGKKNLSPVAVERVANAMSLTGFELVYFRAMVRYDQAKNDSEKQSAFADMEAVADANKTRIMGIDEFTYFNSWKYPVIRELAVAMPGASLQDIADACCRPISLTEVSDALEFLTNARLLKKDKNGRYRLAEKILSSGSADFVPLAVRNMHKQMGSFALESIENVPQDERKFTGLTMGVSEEDYGRIVAELAECRRRIMSIVSSGKNVDRVYRLNMQLFPMSQKLKKNNEDFTEKG